MSTVLATLLIGAGGGVGSALRYAVDTSLSDRLRTRFPWGTVLVNLSGSLLLGLVTGLALAQPWTAIIAVGLLGGYTTFSTASLDSVRLLAEKRYSAAVTHGLGMLLACTSLAAVGIVITSR